MAAEESTAEYTLKLLELGGGDKFQLDETLQKYMREANVDPSSVEVIRSTVDSGVRHNYIKFGANRSTLDAFVTFWEKETGVKLECAIIETSRALEAELPGHLFVKGIPLTYKAEDLREVFGDYGDIESCKIIFNEQGKSRGYGFVNFATRWEANRAIEGVNGKTVEGGVLFVNHHTSKKDRLRDLEEKRRAFTSVYIRNLPPNMPKEQLEGMFSQFGSVQSVIVAKEGGYGFVNFTYHLDAQEAVKRMNGFEAQIGYILQVGRAEHKRDKFQYESLNRHFGVPGSRGSQSPEPCGSQGSMPMGVAMPMGLSHMLPMAMGPIGGPMGPPVGVPPFIVTPDAGIISTATGLPIAGPQYQDSNLYISRLPRDFGDEDLRALFVGYGPIVSAKVITFQQGEDEKRQGESKGFGFVCFASPLDASNALVSMNGYKLNAKSTLQVSFAQRRESKYLKGEIHHYVQNHLGGLYRYLGAVPGAHGASLVQTTDVPPKAHV